VGLAFLAETLAFSETRAPLTVASIEPVVNALRVGVFNNVAWPDFAQIPAEAPVMKYRTLVEEAEQRVGDTWVTPVAVSHTVPTSGFIVHDGEIGFVFSGDTGPTDALWRAARGLNVKAVILECAFPDRLGDIAEASRHMTPARVRREMDKLPANVPVWIYHVKPQFYEETAEELVRIDGARVLLLEQDKTYSL
jgi:ribonuclease BN (tRNA processing enzyme)